LEHSSVALARDLVAVPIVLVALLAAALAIADVAHGLMLFGAAYVAIVLSWPIIADDRQGRYDIHEHAFVRYTKAKRSAWRFWPLVQPLDRRERDVVPWSDILTIAVEPTLPSRTCKVLLSSGRQLSFVVASRRHAELVSIARSRVTRLHRVDGPAWEGPDGTELWALDGVEVPRWVVTSPDPERIMAELPRSAQRRAGLAHYGWDRAIAHLGLTPMDHDPDPTVGTLYQLPAELSDDDEDMNLLVARNASPNPDGSHTVYGLTAPPWSRTAEEAQAALLRLTVRQYRAIQVHT
jgi:hypothetical protein